MTMLSSGSAGLIAGALPANHGTQSEAQIDTHPAAFARNGRQSAPPVPAPDTRRLRWEWPGALPPQAARATAGARRAPLPRRARRHTARVQAIPGFHRPGIPARCCSPGARVAASLPPANPPALQSNTLPPRFARALRPDSRSRCRRPERGRSASDAAPPSSAPPYTAAKLSVRPRLAAVRLRRPVLDTALPRIRAAARRASRRAPPGPGFRAAESASPPSPRAFRQTHPRRRRFLRSFPGRVPADASNSSSLGGAPASWRPASPRLKRDCQPWRAFPRHASRESPPSARARNRTPLHYYRSGARGALLPWGDNPPECPAPAVPGRPPPRAGNPRKRFPPVPPDCRAYLRASRAPLLLEQPLGHAHGLLANCGRPHAVQNLQSRPARIERRDVRRAIHVAIGIVACVDRARLKVKRPPVREPARQRRLELRPQILAHIKVRHSRPAAEPLQHSAHRKIRSQRAYVDRNRSRCLKQIQDHVSSHAMRPLNHRLGIHHVRTSKQDL